MTPWRDGLRLVLQAALVTGLAAGSLLILAGLTLQWAILPHIEDWRPELERHASRAVGVPVRIGHIRVHSSSWIPALELRDVVLYDPSGPEALRLPRVSAALSPRSLLVLAPRLSQLYVEDAHLVVRRDLQGHLHVAGIDLPAAGAAGTPLEDTGALDWFFSQHEFVLRHGSIRWIDEARGAPPLELSDVDFVARNGLRSHAMRLDATPPPAWGERFTVRLRARQPLFAPAGDWRRWTGTLYAQLPRGDVSQLRAHVDLPFEIDGGQGAVALWLDFQTNGWRGATADVRLQDVRLRLAADVQPLAIAHASGRFTAARSATGLSFGAEHFGFSTPDGLVWPAGNLRLGWSQRQTLLKPAQAMARSARGAPAPSSGAPTVLWDTDRPVTGGQLAADLLDLGLMRRIADSLPLPAPARRWLAETQPAGIVKGLDGRWDGPLEAPAHYRLQAQVSGFGIAPGATPPGLALGRPGWRNAQLRLLATETGGRAFLGLDGGQIELPGLYDVPVIAFDRFAAEASWTVEHARLPGQPDAVSLALRDVRFANDDAAGTLQLQWRTGPGLPSPSAAGASTTGASAPDYGPGLRWPGQLDLSGELARARADRIWRYFPRGIPEDTRRYLRAAFSAGQADHVKFAVRGDVADFPFDHGRRGEFRIDAHVSDATLTYAPGAPPADGPVGMEAAEAMRAGSPWPAFTQVQGEVLIDHGALEIRHAAGRWGGVTLSDVQGEIRPLYERQVLGLQGRAHGPLPEFLRYVARSPLGAWMQNALAGASGTGDTTLELALALPLAHADQATVSGRLTLAGNDVRVVPDMPLLAGARARIDFTQRGVTVSGGSARALGGELGLEGGTQPDGTLRFQAQGSATAEGLRRSLDDPALQRLATRLAGQASYRLQLGIARGRTEFTLTSPLTGLGVALPAPLSKAPEAAWPLRVVAVPGADAAGRPRDTLRVEVDTPAGPLVQAEVQRDLSGAAPVPVRAAYALGAPLPAAQPGGVAVVRTGALDADAWWALARTLGAAGAAGAAGAGGAAPRGGGPPGADYWPATASLHAAGLLLGGHRLTGVDLQLLHGAGPAEPEWRVDVASDQARGVVEYRPDTPSRGAQVFARLDRLALEAGEGAGEASGRAAGTPAEASSIPALDIVVDDFELGARKLGKLEVSATSQAGGRDWRLARLSLTVPEARLTGTGQWSGAPQRRMNLDFTLDLADSGAFLQRLGMGRVMRGGKGTLSGQVGWSGSPLGLDIPSLGGTLQIALDQGQFLKADAGAARLLGVLSLQSLPRRLTLDFRDLFQAGFAFDNVSGDARVEHGVATTHDLRMRGLSAVVLMDGSADLQAETQDLRVVVVPVINAGAASLAYAAFNPVVGLTTFLAQLFLSHPLAQAGTREFHVAGPWADPKVEAVEYRGPLGAGAASGPSSAASSAGPSAGLSAGAGGPAPASAPR